MERKIQSLNGYWDYSINGVEQGKVQVPFSALCVGSSKCEVAFDAQEAPFAKLCFEGITYQAKAELNDTFLGKMGPYSRYEYDVTSLLKPTNNHLVVWLEDMNMPFGPSEGWENYGGIIRDVYLTYADAVHISDFVWRTHTEEPYAVANCSVKVDVEGAAQAAVTAMLLDEKGKCVATANAVTSEGNCTLEMCVEEPVLWSTERPSLYTLKLQANEDSVCCKVGIKDFRIRGQRFYLNGQPLFLKGLNRHDMWGDHGYTLTREQMETDMCMLKAAGCNYVRLVHYPHHPYILDLADRIGLLVSEEPGLWWSDMHNPEVVNGALEVMRRVVIRDRNHCSVAFWLAFNECVFTPEFLEASSSLCRQLDPGRYVSGANAMNKEMTRELYKKHGFDFYTRHPYTYNIAQFEEEAAYLDDMPLVFTEWGGFFVYENGALFEDCLQDMIRLWKNQDGQPVLAGCAYWCWADMYEFGRGLLACDKGILNEGLVDIYRQPRTNLERFTRIMNAMDLPEMKPSFMEVTAAPVSKACLMPVDIWKNADKQKQEKAWTCMLENAKPQKGYVHKKERRLSNGPVLPQNVEMIAGLPVCKGTQKPLVIEHDKPVTVAVGEKVSQLHFIGNVALPYGYPLYGEYGAACGKYVLHYADGECEETILRNGIELTTVLGQQGPSRINPIAPGVSRAISWSYDENWEHYIANRFTIKADPQKVLASVEMVSNELDCTMLVYALTVAKEN